MQLQCCPTTSQLAIDPSWPCVRPSPAPQRSFCIRRFFEVRRPSDTGLLPPEQRQRSCPICRAPLQLGGLSADAGLDAHCTRAFPGLHRQRASETAQVRRCGRLLIKSAVRDGAAAHSAQPEPQPCMLCRSKPAWRPVLSSACACAWATCTRCACPR